MGGLGKGKILGKTSKINGKQYKKFGSPEICFPPEQLKPLGGHWPPPGLIFFFVLSFVNIVKQHLKNEKTKKEFIS